MARTETWAEVFKRLCTDAMTALELFLNFDCEIEEKNVFQHMVPAARDGIGVVHVCHGFLAIWKLAYRMSKGTFTEFKPS